MGLYMNYDGTGTNWAAKSDILDGEWIQEDSVPRKVVRIGFTGGAGVGDMVADLYYGEQLVCNNLNNTATTVATDDDMIINSSRKVCRAGEAIRFVIRDAAASGTAHLVLDVKDAQGGKRI